ncbi:uncharacterized protein LOC128553801 [Mercenaria mercenaria]|uniref:uncharacterized protein LOC128553801 n=1 Tax=Mercenaria mercenaria TaxID=6596 RepID=UPI00234F0EBE|nr:uncharacterized protein LOC128553801 [Mercenaria mercenaria]
MRSVVRYIMLPTSKIYPSSAPYSQGTPLNENQQIQTEIKSSPNYRAVGDDDEEFACQGGKGASKQDIVTELNQEYFDCPGDEEWMSFLYSGKKKVAKRLLELGHLPKQRILNEICLLFGRKSKVTIMICNAICVHIKSKNEHIIDVWAAYTLQNMNSITFVVSLEEFENTGRDDQAESIRIDKMIDYSFIKRIVGKYSYESTEIMNHNVTSGEDFDDDAYCKLQTCVAKYSVELMKQHKYLSIVSACSKRSTGYGPSLNLKPENCIVLYVHTKHYIPINEDPFKTHYDEIPVDVREGVFIRFGRTATDFLDHVQMGCQIRGEVENGQYVEGTLGCFIDHPQYGVCGLTCAHVLLSPWDLIRLKSVHNGTFNWPLHDMQRTVYQPANQTNDIGHTVQLVYKEGSENCSGMEVALFKLTNRYPKSSDVPDASVTVASTTAMNINYEHWRICSAERLNSRMKHVIKFGSKTELRAGIIEFGTMAVKELNSYPLATGYFSIKLHKQIEVRPQNTSFAFADKGDSGSLVFLVGDNSSEHTCIGIVEGGTSYGTVVVSPIVPILDELKVSSLKSFDSANTLSEIHGKIENVGSEVQTVKNDVQTLTGEMQRMRGDMQTEMQNMTRDIQNIDSRMDNRMQQIQQMLSVLLPPHNYNTHQSPAPSNT